MTVSLFTKYVSAHRVTILVFIATGLLVLLGLKSNSDRHGPTAMPGTMDSQPAYAELEYLSREERSLAERKDFFRALARTKGAAYAFDVLRRALPPQSINSHFLAHPIGEELYRQEGAAGMRLCTREFRNACSHAIVIGMFSERGDAALADITAVCQKLDRRLDYDQCFHGLGHGILMHTGYDLAETIRLCRGARIPEYSEREFAECVGGATMELTAGTISRDHNRILWEQKSAKYVKNDDPLYPCTNAIIPDAVRYRCFGYLAPHLLRSTGAGSERLQLSNIERAFTFCDRIPAAAGRERSNCFGGFGIDFVALIQSSDARNSEGIDRTQLQSVYEWCRLAGVADGIAACIGQATHMLYWDGASDHSTVLSFCNLMDDNAYQSECVNQLIRAVELNMPNPNARRSLCTQLPAAAQAECRARLGR